MLMDYFYSMKGVYMKDITKDGTLSETIEELKIIKEDWKNYFKENKIILKEEYINYLCSKNKK